MSKTIKDIKKVNNAKKTLPLILFCLVLIAAVLIVLMLYNDTLFVGKAYPVIRMECAVKNEACNGVTVFKISALTNAHAGDINSDYPYNVCCQNMAVTTTCDAANPNVVLKLSSSSNAHAETASNTNYNTNICLEPSSKVSCGVIETGNCEDNGYETCLISLSSDTNAHVADCDSGYSKKICCKPQKDIELTGLTFNPSDLAAFVPGTNVIVTPAITPTNLQKYDEFSVQINAKDIYGKTVESCEKTVGYVEGVDWAQGKVFFNNECIFSNIPKIGTYTFDVELDAENELIETNDNNNLRSEVKNLGFESCSVDEDCVSEQSCMIGTCINPVCSYTLDTTCCGNNICEAAEDCSADCGTDSDGDGYKGTGDCSDNNNIIYPGATELCNGIDDDCDTKIDDLNNGAAYSACPFIDNNLNNGLYSYWDFDNALNPAEDSYGTNDGIVNGAVWTSNGASNGALNFDGNDYVGLIDSRESIGSFSWSGWVQLLDTEVDRVIYENGDSQNGYQIYLTAAGKLGAAYVSSGTVYKCETATAVDDNNWHFVAMTANIVSNELRLYLDGADVCSGVTITPITVLSSEGSFIGSSFDDYVYLDGDFNGLIDEVGIWNKALSSSEILEIKNSYSVCNDGTNLCSDGICRISCGTNILACDNDGTCDNTEACNCDDCAGLQSICAAGLRCNAAAKVCDDISAPVLDDGICGEAESCVNSPADCGTCAGLHCGDAVCNNGETGTICARDCSVCNTAADTNCNGCVADQELNNYAQKWFNDLIDDGALNLAASKWYLEEGCQ